MLFFEFPEDARWNADREAVEFGVILGPYEGTVRIARRVFQHLLEQAPTPERCRSARALHPPGGECHVNWTLAACCQ